MDSGTSFVSLADPNNPVVIGYLPTETTNIIWRDLKVYNHHVFIVAEALSHGTQIFDLTHMEHVNVTEFTIFNTTSNYNGHGRAHNIAINEDSGYAYVVGSSSDSCNGGLHMIDIHDPIHPVFAGCYSERGYTHDVQCVIYDGPDDDYLDHEICFASNEDQVDIIDVTDKSNPVYISSCQYFGYAYVHQGWLTEDKHYFVIDDENDELFSFLDISRTETFICDVSNLDRPFMKTMRRASTKASDHNQYIKGDFSYQSNYQAGLRIIDLSNIKCGGKFLEEVGYFDIYPENDLAGHDGTWSNYPFFESGIVILTGIFDGLFVVRPDSHIFQPRKTAPKTILSTFRNSFQRAKNKWKDALGVLF